MIFILLFFSVLFIWAIPSCVDGVLCLDGTHGQNANRMISLANALHRAKDLNMSHVALDETWSSWYKEWFDRKENIVLDYRGVCLERISASDAFRAFSHHEYNDYLNYLHPSDHIVNEAIQRFKSQIPFVSVHRRDLEGSCHARHRRPNRSYFCFRQIKEDLAYTCDWKEADFTHLNSSIILFTDGENPTYDNTFTHRSQDNFQIQMWAMTMSSRHFGNPTSSIDYVVAHWRKSMNREVNSMSPDTCYNYYKIENKKETI